MNARDFVEQIEKFDVLIENKRMEKRQWQDIATSITASMQGEKVKSSPNQDKMGTAVASYLDIQGEIDMYIIQCASERQKIIGVLERLPITEYNVLYKKYVLMQDYQTIADSMGKSYSWATSWHGTALAHLQKILDEEKR